MPVVASLAPSSGMELLSSSCLAAAAENFDAGEVSACKFAGDRCPWRSARPSDLYGSSSPATADDAIVHCSSEWHAKQVLEAIRGRLKQCGLELHPRKTQIVYCKDADRRGNSEYVSFDFLGYTFQPRRAKHRRGKYFVSFLPAISAKAARFVRQTIRKWRMASRRSNQRLEVLARAFNPTMRGWANFYGRFCRSKFLQVLRHFNVALSAWVRRKYTRFRNRERASMHWLGCIARREPKLFVPWRLGLKPEAGK